VKVYLIRWGVIGCGGIADRRTIPEGIIPAEDSKLVAVMSRSEGTAERIAKKYGVKRYYTKEESLLMDSEVDAIYIATPNNLHAVQTIAAAEYGKHVLCEKPLALTIEDCEAIMASCRKNGVKLQVGFMMRFHACHQEAHRIIKQGLIGQPVMARAELTCWYPKIPGAWRQDPKQGGGGCLTDMGLHCIDLLRMFLGEVVEVHAFIDSSVFDYPVEDSSIVTLGFVNRAHGIVDNFYNIPDDASQNRLEIYGTKGCILTDGTIGQNSTGMLKVYTQKGEKDYEASQKRELAIGITEIIPPSTNIYRAEVEHLIKCIQDNTEPMNSGHEAIKDQRIVEAAYESSRSGRKITMNTK
jgi:predicted dehydrogenase